jgi:hypothetical protein
VVEGNGAFPRDMLRYDNCTPMRAEDRAVTEARYDLPETHDVLWDGNNLRHNRVQLLLADDAPIGWRPTFERWRSCCWIVTELPQTVA